MNKIQRIRGLMSKSATPELALAVLDALPDLLSVAEAATYTVDAIAAAVEPHPDVGGIRRLKDALAKLEIT